jgi:hypothetical protein
VKDLAQLRRLSDDGLRSYFNRHAEYHPPGGGSDRGYSIRAEAVALFDADTLGLWLKFERAVRLDEWPARAVGAAPQKRNAAG